MVDLPVINSLWYITTQLSEEITKIAKLQVTQPMSEKNFESETSCIIATHEIDVYLMAIPHIKRNNS
jgi:hypothetical protein